MKIKVKANAFKKFKELPPDVLSQIESKLTLGETGLDVAKWLQQDLKLFSNEDTYTLKKALERYRSTEVRAKAMERIAGTQRNEATAVVVRRMNAMEEMDTLAQQQRARLDKILMQESELPKGILLKDATREIGLLKDLIVDVGRLQLETGVLPRASKTIKGSVTKPDGTVSRFEWTEEQEQLFRELEGIREDAA